MKTSILCLLIAGTCITSVTAAEQADKTKKAPPLGERKELARDDGASAGKGSIAKSGHAVRFQAPGTNAWVTAVKIFGSRYGHPTPPAENFQVWICDADFKPIATAAFAYGSFARGNPAWHTFPVKPVLVPEKFYVCAAFNPAQTKGVFVHHDASGCGDSFTGLPGHAPQAFGKGDWLIRAVIQEPAK